MSWKIRKLREAADQARRKDDYAELARLYEQLEKTEPSEPEWPKRAADAYARIKRQDKELEALLRAAEAYSRMGFLLKAVAVCKRILRLDPTHTVTQERLVELHSGRMRGLQRVRSEPEVIAARSPHIFPPGARGQPEERPGPEPTPKPPQVEQRPKHATARSAALLSALRRERLNVVGSRSDSPRQPASPEVRVAPARPAPPADPQPLPPALAREEPSQPRIAVSSESTERQRSIPPGAALQDVTLAEVVPTSRRLTPVGRRAVYEIPLEIDVIEVDEAELIEVTSLPPPEGAGAAEPQSGPVDAPAQHVPPEIAPGQARVEPEGPARDLAGSLDDVPGSRPIEFELSPNDVRPNTQIGIALSRVPLFSELDPLTLAALIQGVDFLEVPRGELVYSAGDAADRLFVVARGEITLLSPPPQKYELGRCLENEFFGELGLLSDSQRPTSAVASDDSELLVIDRRLISDLAESEPSVLTVLLRFIRERLVNALVLTSPLFAPFAGGERRALASRFHFLEVESDVELLARGKRADGLYILLSGEAEVSLRGEPLQSLLPGDVFGELSLMDGSPSEESVVSMTKCFALRLDGADFREIIMTHPQVLEYLAELAEARREVRQGLFSDFPAPPH